MAKSKYQIIMMTLLAGPQKTWNAGKVLNVPDQCSHVEAEQLIEGKYAKKYISPEAQAKLDKKAQEADDSASLARAAEIQKKDDELKIQEAALDSRKEEISEGLKSIEEQESDLESRKKDLAEGLVSVKSEESDLDDRKKNLVQAKDDVSKLETAAAPKAPETAEAPAAKPAAKSTPPPGK